MDDPTAGNYGADPSILEKDGASLACLAVEYDQKGQYQTAAFYYSEAAQALLQASLAGSQIPKIVDRANEYILRAESLRSSAASQVTVQKTKTPEQLKWDRAQFLLHQAFQEDENKNVKEAIDLYTHAVELYIAIRGSTKDTDRQSKATKLASQALDRAEQLKPQTKITKPFSTGIIDPILMRGDKVVPPLGFGAFADSDDEDKKSDSVGPARSPTIPQKHIINTGPSGYTKDEIEVLRKTSFINGREYVPFMSVDMKERFAYPVAFSDRDGKLAMSPKQKSKFSQFVRPEEMCDSPQMIYAVSSFSIRQTIVSDCSFVASLAISAQYERRFKKKLITSIIYPQNKQGLPVYNPCGKYMVKLHINGVTRKVIIDDFLPMGRDGELLCSFSQNKNELWVSLLEKAYLKVMGGYDFPGSNSNIDLHALTGWIPERIAIRLSSQEFDQNKEFHRILERFHKGHCLVTVATGEIPEREADRAGLVPTHAYAMLDIREVKGQKLFMLKNPWSHLRWKGNYSENDMAHWTPELQKTLNYDPKSAQTVDNGVFWIDIDSLCKFYDVFYINWNPDLFNNTTCLHHTWSAKEGPTKDSYNISDNPQYRLEIKASTPAAVWMLLTRHITDKDDFANNKEFITLLMYKTGGKKVYYPYDPPPFKDGVRINSPHYLCKTIENRGTSVYTLVISQYEKNNTIHYTLRAYATCEFSLTKIADPYKQQYKKRVTGQWKGRSAGGCANNVETHKLNPIYQLKMDNSSADNHILVELLGPKQYSVGFLVITVTENVPSPAGSSKKNSSGDFRPGYCVLQLDRLSGGVYNITPCTFQAGKEGPFFLDVSSSCPITLTQLQ